MSQNVTLSMKISPTQALVITALMNGSTAIEAASDRGCETGVTRGPWRCWRDNRVWATNGQARGCEARFVYTSVRMLEKRLNRATLRHFSGRSARLAGGMD
jgi:hypothetical protein